MAQSVEFVIDRQFNGPPRSGNGGYVAGRMAALIDGAVEVTLRAPPPLDTRLALTRDDDDVFRLRDGALVLAEARAAPLELDVPPAPSVDAAFAAGQQGGSPESSPYGGCFVCGRARRPGDGLRVWAAPLNGRTAAVAPWTPDPACSA